MKISRSFYLSALLLGVVSCSRSSSPPFQGSSVLEAAPKVVVTQKPECATDADCPRKRTCLTPVCILPRGVCGGVAMLCDDGNSETLDVCVEGSGCENRPVPGNLLMRDECKGLAVDVVCARGINYANPCSAARSGVMQYSVAPCRLLGDVCSSETSSCVTGTSCSADGHCRASN